MGSGESWSHFFCLTRSARKPTCHSSSSALRAKVPSSRGRNTSRGPMVDAEALAAAVRDKKIAGAAIDVFDQEPPPPSHPLFGLDNVILTPHLGWASEEAGWEIRKSILDDILAAAVGRPARCVVNTEVLG